MGIHPTAVVGAGATLGPDVDLGPYCVIGPNVRLGARTRIHPHAVIEGDTWLGDDCEVFSFAVVGSYPQDKKLKPGEAAGRLRIGNRTAIREHVTVHCGTSFGGGVTTIGDHVMLLVGAHVGHDATVGSHVVFTNGAMAAGHVTVMDRAILGAMVGVHQFARIGAVAMVGAGAMVTHDVPPFATVQGDRARLVGINTVGLRRNGFDALQQSVVKRVFRMLFWRPGTLQQRLEAVRESPLYREDTARAVVDFVAASRRGVCLPRRRLRGEASYAGGGSESRGGLDNVLE